MSFPARQKGDLQIIICFGFCMKKKMFFYVVPIFRFFFLLMNGILILGLIILRIYNIII